MAWSVAVFECLDIALSGYDPEDLETSPTVESKSGDDDRDHPWCYLGADGAG